MFSLKILLHLFLIRPILNILFGVNLFGKENLEKLNNFILVANHNSHLDILLLFYLLPANQIRETHPVAAREYFSKSKLVFVLVKYLFDPVWVSRNDSESIKQFMNQVNDKLEKGHNLIIFPEGTRGLAGEMQTFKTGIGKIAEQYKHIPIIPVYLSGTERSLPKRYSIPVPLWHNIVIGPPQVFQHTHKEFTQSLENIIREFANNEMAARHKRKSKNLRPANTIAFIGIDGSGKSTLSKNVSISLSEKSKVALISDILKFYEKSEVKQAQPILTENIRTRVSDYAKSAKSLKQYKIPKLAELLLRDVLLNEVKRWCHPAYIVLDGSPLLNLTSWAILYKEEYFNANVCLKVIKVLSSNDSDIAKDDPVFKQFSELSILKNVKLNHLNLPDAVIFLDVDPKIAMERIDKRGKVKQVHETEEKLTKLREAYLITCIVLQEKLQVPVLLINGNDSIQNIETMARDFIHKSLNKKQHHEKQKN
ncbi:MAG: hypothetical protein CVT99_07865 [Bacteroidetes bacterium HGW-Bacteroidetes-16]|jgi:1-acyl-sn-glycerol-3-phosphate acyltransferase|nr:MAG: hypothetical protein CVT99_07865 [Bacteroidetes bacterium HGW-Bacteroidetes-16]